MGNDVKRAYFYEPSLKPTFVQISVEDFEPGDEHRAASCLCQCVARGQPQEFGRGATKKFSRQMDSPHLHLRCIFYHSTGRILVFVHSDDFASTGHGEELRWLE